MDRMYLSSIVSVLVFKSSTQHWNQSCSLAHTPLEPEATWQNTTVTESSQAHPKCRSEGPVKSLQYCIGSQELWHVAEKSEFSTTNYHVQISYTGAGQGIIHLLHWPSVTALLGEKRTGKEFTLKISTKRRSEPRKKDEPSSPILSIFLLLCPFRISESLLEKSPHDFLLLLQTYLYRFKEMKAFVQSSRTIRANKRGTLEENSNFNKSVKTVLVPRTFLGSRPHFGHSSTYYSHQKGFSQSNVVL